jgi:hypothetical protein
VTKGETRSNFDRTRTAGRFRITAGGIADLPGGLHHDA